MTVKKKLILEYLEERGNHGASPTNLGMHVFRKPYNQASSYVASALRVLLAEGLITTNHRGTYYAA